MFQSITCIKEQDSVLICRLHDTTFSVDNIKINYSNDSRFIRTVYQELVIIREYKKRNLNVAQNLARYYINFFKEYNLGINPRRIYSEGQLLTKLVSYRTHIDAFRPDLNYGDKYFKCVLRQMCQLTNGFYNGSKNI